MALIDNIEEVHPVFPLENRSHLIEKNTKILLERLLQSLEAEHTEIDQITLEFKKLAIKHGLDYEKFSQEILTSNKDSEEEKDDIEQIINSKSFETNKSNNSLLNNVNYDSKYESERIYLLNEIHREMKMTKYFEGLLTQYETLLSYTLDKTRTRKYNVSKEMKLHKMMQESKLNALRENNDKINRTNIIGDIEISQAFDNIKVEINNLNNNLQN